LAVEHVQWVFKPNAVDERRFHTIFGFSPFRGPASVLRLSRRTTGRVAGVAEPEGRKLLKKFLM
jgi:hypothetical protein